MSSSIMRDIVFRTNGEMYIGIVGAVRSGKSMFIRKFMETKVLPYVTDDITKHKIVDELPQSADGKTIMTVEPKFVPTSAVDIVIEEEITFSVRLVDCVGYIIPNAKGYVNDDGTPRLVRTPWFSENIPFEEAAYIGTKKVIENHSNIGILLTSDGSFGEFTKKDYEQVEEKIVEELKATEKPFVIVLNTTEPNSDKTVAHVEHMKIKYNNSVIAIDVSNMTASQIDKILKEALSEFDINKLDIQIPTWLSALVDSHPVKHEFDDIISKVTGEFRKFKDVDKIKEKLKECQLFENVAITSLDSATGDVEITIECHDNLYHEILEGIIGEAIDDKGKFITLLQDCMIAKKEYDYVKVALETVKQTGYGIAIPTVNDMILETPEVIKQGSRYGVKLKAIAPSIHMIKVDVESTFEPIIGSEAQSKQFVDKIMEDYDNNPEGIWNAEIFGRKLSEVINDGIKAKLYLIPETAQYKFKESLEKIVNKSKGGILVFIL